MIKNHCLCRQTNVNDKLIMAKIVVLPRVKLYSMAKPVQVYTIYFTRERRLYDNVFY